MPSTVIFYCNYISANIGVPGVNQALIADIGKHCEDGYDVLGSDYKKYYRFKWISDTKEIEITEVPDDEVENPKVVVFSAFDPYRWMLPKMLKWRKDGSQIAIWTWGYYTKQQCSENWEHGKVPRWLKYIATRVKKYTLDPLTDYYFISGESEIRDSTLDSNKCVRMPMGRPQSSILDACDAIHDVSVVKFGKESINYIGRGRWHAKGLDNIVEYAKSQCGSRWLFRLFISTKEEGFDEEVSKNNLSNIEWHFDVLGADNLSWLHKSAAFITINKNPTMIRATYESLYAGTPIIVLREAYMDGFKGLLDEHGLNNSVQIITDEQLASMSFEIVPMAAQDRIKLTECMHMVLDAGVIGRWFGAWLKRPSAPSSYFKHVSEKLFKKTSK